jgi:hypothetical protein
MSKNKKKISIAIALVFLLSGWAGLFIHYKKFKKIKSFKSYREEKNISFKHSKFNQYFVHLRNSRSCGKFLKIESKGEKGTDRENIWKLSLSISLDSSGNPNQNNTLKEGEIIEGILVEGFNFIWQKESEDKVQLGEVMLNLKIIDNDNVYVNQKQVAIFLKLKGSKVLRCFADLSQLK